LKIIFQADADLDPDIGRRVRRREPAIDFRPAAGVIPDGTADDSVLRISADAGRVLVTRDVRTMGVHFWDFVAQYQSPGVLLIPSSRTTGDAIEGILTVWLTWTAAEFRNQIRWLP
jgi:hypothetical protein